MSDRWMNSVRAVVLVLLGNGTIAACAPRPDQPAAAGVYDPSTDNSDSAPYQAWFKERP